MAIENILSDLKELSQYDCTILKDISYWKRNLKNDSSHDSEISRREFSGLCLEVKKCHDYFSVQSGDLKRQINSSAFNECRQLVDDVNPKKSGIFSKFFLNAGISSLAISTLSFTSLGPYSLSLAAAGLGLGLICLSKAFSVDKDEKIGYIGNLLTKTREHAESYLDSLKNLNQAIDDKFYDKTNLSTAYYAHINSISSIQIGLHYLCNELDSSMSGIKDDYTRVSHKREERSMKNHTSKGKVLSEKNLSQIL